jgi:hypothetical protein
VRFASANPFLASLHSSVNQGASVLPHLLGFLGWVVTIFLTTPAVVAYYNMNSSTAAALFSLFMLVSFTNVCNPSKKSGLCVNSSQDFADVA